MEYPIKKLLLLLGAFLLTGLSICSAQEQGVAFIDTSLPMLCSSTNGDPIEKEYVILKVSGPSGTKWHFSYSINGGAPISANNGADITDAVFDLVLNFRNEKRSIEQYTVSLKEAWLESGTALTIDPLKRELTIDVFPLPIPEITEYPPITRTNSVENYEALIGKNSDFDVRVPDGTNLVSVQTEIQDRKKIVRFTIQWAPTPGTLYFRFLETNAMGCNSDPLFAGVELVEHFSIDLNPLRNICKGESITLTPRMNLEGNYLFNWSTGETSQSIKVSEPGIYKVTVTDPDHNEVQEAQVEVIVHDPPVIDIPDILILEDVPLTVDATAEGSTYLWSSGETSPSIQINEAGEYFVTVTSEFGCSTTQHFKVKNRSDVFTISMTPVTPLCAGETIVLAPQIDIEQDYQYLWNTGATTPSIQVTQSGAYSVEVTDPDGLTQTASTDVEEHPLPIVDLGEDFTLWDGQNRELDAGNPGAQYQWNTGATSQKITVSSGGTFSVTVTDQFNCQGADEVSVDYRAGHRFQVELGENIALCEGDSVRVEGIIDGAPDLPLTYHWTPSGEKAPYIYLKSDGLYCLEVTDANLNIETDCIEVQLLPSPEVDLGEDIQVYPDEPVVLDAQNPGCFYHWSTDEITQSIEVQQTGTYWVEVINQHNCSKTDTIQVDIQDAYPFVGLPKAFSPNGDGLNEVLFVRGHDYQSIHLMIFNRLGQKVFETSDPNSGWDGTFHGVIQDMDAYIYSLKVVYPNGKVLHRKGNFTLLR